jgi:hypothetical protein
MVDTLEWRAPYGVLGALFDRLLLQRHMLWFVTKKQQALKALAEATDAG